ncbi:MAG TPA: A24 family peptidase [Planctomycetaceae bacterium]|nr:A24 family peptidase [Planctomycetaceae bacterium]
MLALLAVASVTDVREHKIYNWNTYPGIVLGLILNLAIGGWIGLQDSAMGFALCGFIMVACFILFNIGGGDVKLISMMGAFLGIQDGIEAMLWTFILGSIMGLAILIWKLGFIHILKKSWEHLRLVFQAKGWIPPTDEERQPMQRWLFLAPAGFAAGCIILAKPWLHTGGIFC